MRLNLLRQAEAEVKFGRKNVWTSEGKVFTRNNNKIVLVRPEDLEKFYYSHGSGKDSRLLSLLFISIHRRLG